MAKTKKPNPLADAVAAAELLKASKDVELAQARETVKRLERECSETVKRLERECSEAVQAIREAQTAADALLPQCRMVSSGRGSEQDMGRVVLRKTPGGMLVARPVGMGPPCLEYRFKWRESGGEFHQAEKSTYWGSSIRKLRDVPPEFLPAIPSPA